MTQQVLHVRAILPMIDMADDPASVGMTFEATGTNEDVNWAGVLEPALVTFFDGIGGYIGRQVSRSENACTFEAYDVTAHLAGTTPVGSPLYITPFTLSSGGSVAQTIASGVGAVVSYRADYGSDVEFGPGTRPRSRDRNRFYLGPLNPTFMDNDATTHRCRLAAAACTDILSQLATLAELHSGGSDQTNLVVWSRKNASVKNAVEAWMDDRPDYQRRRSDPSAVKFTQSLTGS